MIDTRPRWYRLVGHEPVACSQAEYLSWCMALPWDLTHRVALTEEDDWRVSTVFLGLDHGWFTGQHELFETMVFGAGAGDIEEQQWRYASWEEAVAGHERVVAELRRRQSSGVSGSS